MGEVSSPKGEGKFEDGQGKVGEFESNQGSIREFESSQRKVTEFCVLVCFVPPQKFSPTNEPTKVRFCAFFSPSA